MPIPDSQTPIGERVGENAARTRGPYRCGKISENRKTKCITSGSCYGVEYGIIMAQIMLYGSSFNIMNRRSFIQQLSSAVVGCYLALSVKLPTASIVDETIVPTITRINPDWVNAPYELAFYHHPSMTHLVPVTYKRSDGPPATPHPILNDAYPIRFNAPACGPISPIIES